MGHIVAVSIVSNLYLWLIVFALKGANADLAKRLSIIEFHADRLGLTRSFQDLVEGR